MLVLRKLLQNTAIEGDSSCMSD